MYPKMKILLPFWTAIYNCCHMYREALCIQSCGTYKVRAKVCKKLLAYLWSISGHEPCGLVFGHSSINLNTQVSQSK